VGLTLFKWAIGEFDSVIISCAMKGNLLRTWALWSRGLILALLSVSLVALFTEYAHAQVVKFARTYGQVVYDWASSVLQTSDGGYIVAGGIRHIPTSHDHILLIKTDANGNKIWDVVYYSTYYKYVYSILPTSDGRYIVVGWAFSIPSYEREIILLKTIHFSVSWIKAITLPYYSSNEEAYSAQQTSDGGYVLAGWTNIINGSLLVKIDSSGDVQWAKAYRISYDDAAYSVQQTSDGGYVLAGWTNFWSGGNNFDAFLIKTDASGNVQWAKTYGGTNNDSAYSVQQTSDGGYILAGVTYSFGAGGGDAFLIKTDASGNLQWAKTYGGAGIDKFIRVLQTSDGGYIAVGYTSSFGAGGYDVFLVKTDENGNVIWAKTYGGANNDVASSIQRTSDGGYIVAGTTWSFGAGNGDVFLIKTDANGNIGSCGIVRNVTPTVTIPSLTVNTRSVFVRSEYPSSYYADIDVMPDVVLSSAPCPLSEDNELGISESCKPASGLITPYKGGIKVSGSGEFEVKVYNVSGVMVKSIKGKDEVKLDLSRGVYFVEVVSGGKVIREKVVIR